MSDRARSRKQSTKGRRRLRIWGIVNLAVLLAFTGWVFRNAEQTNARDTANAAATTQTGQAGASASASASAAPTATKTAASVPTKAQILAETTSSSSSAKYFGVSATDVPWSATGMQSLAKEAGASPNMVEYYVNWSQKFDPAAVLDSYDEGALPLITWEPFAGLTGSQSGNVNESSYSLTTIIDGAHDGYITEFADAVKAVKVPVVFRFAHEMNGNWYPWSEGVDGNTTGQYVQAWRHVWTLFQQAGTTNVIWDWAPNILRGATNSDLAELYPGDKYVDWVGVTAYDDKETTADALLSPTVDKIREFTQKPLLISETGAQPGWQKAAFTADFLSWLPKQSGVIGFVWNEITKAQGAGADWGFDADSATLAAFRSGIKDLALVKVPAA